MIAQLVNRIAHAAGLTPCVIGVAGAIALAFPAAAQDASRPNILVIWGDDIGWYNISAYSLG